MESMQNANIYAKIKYDNFRVYEKNDVWSMRQPIRKIVMMEGKWFWF